MQRALDLAAKGRASTSPNPMVGAVIVKGGRIVSEGWHARAGSDHAEIVAIKNTKERVKGSTLYVTLEPCHHWGRTPPCVDAVIEHDFKEVIIAVKDPNPLTAGKSIRKMKQAGIKVTVGVCEEQARKLNEVFFKYMTKKMPFVTAKIAQTLDGKIATAAGSSKWITSEKTRNYAKSLRKNFDAILVGINTVLKDNPVLSAPGKPGFKKIVVDSQLRMPISAKLFEKGKAAKDVILAVTSRAPAARIKKFQTKGATVIVCPLKSGRVDLKSLFKTLAEREITSVLMEGGSHVIGSALKDKLVDRLHIYVAPKIIGDREAKSSIVGINIKDVSKSLQCKIARAERIGEDLFIEADVHYVHRNH